MPEEKAISIITPMCLTEQDDKKKIEPTRFFEAKLMQWAAARLAVLHAALTAEPADDDEMQRIAWLKEKLGR